MYTIPLWRPSSFRRYSIQDRPCVSIRRAALWRWSCRLENKISGRHPVSRYADGLRTIPHQVSSGVVALSSFLGKASHLAVKSSTRRTYRRKAAEYTVANKTYQSATKRSLSLHWFLSLSLVQLVSLVHLAIFPSSASQPFSMQAIGLGYTAEFCFCFRHPYIVLKLLTRSLA